MEQCPKPDTTAIVILAEPILIRLANRLLKNMPPCDRDDVLQNVRVLLLTRIIPGYAGRGPMTHYLTKSIRNALLDESERLHNAQRGVQLPEEDVLPAPTTFGDYDLATILAHPHLSKGERRLLNAILQQPDTDAVARRLNVKRDCVSPLRYRLKQKLIELMQIEFSFGHPARQ